MDLAPYLDSLRRDLAAAAAPGGPEVARAADLLTGALAPAARLCLLDLLSDAAAEITASLETASVEVRLRDRAVDLVVTEIHAVPPTPPPAGTTEPAGEPARITLRLPEALKDGAERAAAAEGISVNAWLVRAVGTALSGASPAPPGRSGRTSSRRITGFAQA